MSEPCGCCKASVSLTPEEIKNRPGLSAVAYRVGTYAAFRQAMLTAISQTELILDGQRFSPLTEWTTRQRDDYGIALLEMWAYLADILTFYQERIANEAYLRTALQRDSLIRLANLIGYQLAPGVAAKTYLAYTLEKNRSLKITPGLRVQSVPGQGETAQKFETVESLPAQALLNYFRVYPAPQSYNPLGEGETSATLLSDTGNLKPGSTIVIYLPMMGTYQSVHVEEKVITANAAVDWRQVLTWEPAIRSGFSGEAVVRKWRNKFRLFGHDAPSRYFSVLVDSQNTVKWSQQYYDYNLEAVNKIDLDATYNTLKENTRILLVADLEKKGYALAWEYTVTGVAQVKAEVAASSEAAPAIQATVTRLSLDQTLPRGIDVRSAVLYELEGDPLSFWDGRYAETVSGNEVCIPLCELKNSAGVAYTAQEATQLLEAGRRIILEDGVAAPHVTTVSSTEVENDHLRITLASALGTALKSDTAKARANVILSTHGETVANEKLGSGNASQAFQSFTLKKSPVTYVPKAGASHGAASTLEVRVGDILWKEVETLYGQSGLARVYSARIDDQGKLTLRFGDGQTGARLPTSKDNLTATYRQGIGQSGIVKADSLSVPLDKPAGLKSVTNPLPASGGADPESLSQARQNAPVTVRTLGRIVSLMDFEDSARAYAGIAKARATWQWDGFDRAVSLTVAGDDGAEIQAGGTTHQDLLADLNSRRDPHRKLVVGSYLPVPVQVTASIKVAAGQDNTTVQSRALAALKQYLAFDNLDLGQPIHLSDVMAVLNAVTGVEAVDVDQLQYRNVADRVSHGANADPVQAHLIIFPNELATVSNSASDLVVKIGLSQT